MTADSKNSKETRISNTAKKTASKRKRAGGKKTVSRTSPARGILHGHWQNVAMILTVYDLIAANMAFFLALWLRFDCRFSSIPQYYLSAWEKFAPIYAIICLFVFWQTRLYKSIWKYASYSELMYLIAATCITGLFHTLFITILYRRMPISYYLVGTTLQFIFMTGVRF